MRVQVCEEDLAWLREYRTEELCEVFDAVHLDMAPADTKVGVRYLFFAIIQIFFFMKKCSSEKTPCSASHYLFFHLISFSCCRTPLLRSQDPRMRTVNDVDGSRHKPATTCAAGARMFCRSAVKPVEDDHSRGAVDSLSLVALPKKLVSWDHGPITIKAPNPKCRLYWCLIEFIDWRNSQLSWCFRPFL